MRESSESSETKSLHYRMISKPIMALVIDETQTTMLEVHVCSPYCCVRQLRCV